MNKNGFTLVEVLAVIAILGMIALIALPSMSNIHSNKEKDIEGKVKENLENAAEVYVQMEGKTDYQMCIKVQTLIDNGVISTKEAKEIAENSKNYYIKVTSKNDSGYEYEYSESCNYTNKY